VPNFASHCYGVVGVVLSCCALRILYEMGLFSEIPEM
jgi:hypothetical protein